MSSSAPSPADGPHPAEGLPPDQSAVAPPEPPFPVVGIGASAGGLEAFTQLLSHIPPDTGMAFVLIQHLDPSQPSLLSALMASCAEIPVQEAIDGIEIAPNQVYVIPPNACMTIAAGQLHLRRRRQTPNDHRTINIFFAAMAQALGNQAIGVVLSGGSDDGTQGLAEIKAAGGITFAQSEASAQVSSMPHAAIAAGQVDFVLSPEDIALAITNIGHHPYVQSVDGTEIDDWGQEPNALARILQLLKATTQVDFAQYKPTTLKRRILRRMALQHLESLDTYCQYLQGSPAEVQALYQEILISVTGFFRNAPAFEALKQEVFPALMRDRDREAPAPIRIWVAGCSTGEEAYSIAIALLEYLAHQSVSPPVQIFATDLSEPSIEAARLGIYLTSQLTDVSPERRQRFFVPVEGGYQVNSVVRELCIFARQNLIHDPPFSRLDLISCRNVLIYFSAVLQQKVLPMFHYGLAPHGFLLLGSSETVGQFADLFALVDRQHRLYVKQFSSLRPSLDFSPSQATPAVNRPLSPSLLNPDSSSDLLRLADEVVLNRYGPAGVVVGETLDIVQFRGQTGDYLDPAPGRASLKLLSLVKPALRLDLRTALYQARQSQQPVLREPIALTQGDGAIGPGLGTQIRLEVVPFSTAGAEVPYYLVLFTPLAPAASSPGPAGTDPAPANDAILQYQQEIQRTQQDLDTTRSHLQSIIQEQEATNQDLRAANEEILSSNEELQSTNEELQTAKEEIQATNEELGTINDELLRRNAETTRISDDFQNLLASIHIPVLMLEGDLRIRRFTPTAVTLFNLIPTDVGRPLSDIKHRLAMENLDAQILRVMETLEQFAQEVQDHEGRWYDLRIRPYRTLDNRIDGAVAVLIDIDDLKRGAEALRVARDYADAIVQTVREALLVIDRDFKVVTANQQFYRLFQVTPGETEQQSIFELGNGQWDRPQLRSLLHDLLPQSQQMVEVEVTHNFEHIGPKTIRLNVRRMPTLADQALILIALEEVDPQ